MSTNKVIGYLAYITKTQLICEGDSCVIASSEAKMKSYLKQMRPELHKKVTITKARFADIKKGLEAGAAYSFDEESYERFRPAALQTGMNLGQGDLQEASSISGLHLIRIQKMTVSSN